MAASIASNSTPPHGIYRAKEVKSPPRSYPAGCTPSRRCVRSAFDWAAHHKWSHRPAHLRVFPQVCVLSWGATSTR